MDSELFNACAETACRSYIPQDSARDLFLRLYDLLVFATEGDRIRAVRMLVDCYELDIPF